jgi:hypothetical protein
MKTGDTEMKSRESHPSGVPTIGEELVYLFPMKDVVICICKAHQELINIFDGKKGNIVKVGEVIATSIRNKAAKNQTDIRTFTLIVTKKYIMANKER